jgi:transposase-like protein
VTVPRGRITGTDGRDDGVPQPAAAAVCAADREIDEAILSYYLGSVNSRRIRTALTPLLGERNLSKSTVSRIVERLKALFAAWQGRDLSTERYPIVLLDGFI